MKIYIGSDHNGYDLKRSLTELLTKMGHEVIDGGNETQDPKDDFPVFAARVVNGMLSDKTGDSMGILLCGSGQGMCMAANRFKGIRACLAWDRESARAARNDDDSNILCLPARMIDFNQAKEIVESWLNTSFAGAPRFVRRINEMDQLN
jgi:ribose 5-phosphate isomerase B